MQYTNKCYLIVNNREDSEEGEYPNQHYRSDDPVPGASVILTTDDSPVAVECDDSDGAYRNHDVSPLDRWDQLTQDQAEVPAPPDDPDQSERHAHQAQEHVGHREVGDVEVAGRLHGRPPGHYEDDDEVGQDAR